MVLVPRPLRSSLWSFSKVNFSVKGVVEAFASSGVDVPNSSLLVENSLVCQPTLMVVVPTSVLTLLIIGARASVRMLFVVKENSEEVAVFPDASTVLMSA